MAAWLKNLVKVGGSSGNSPVGSIVGGLLNRTTANKTARSLERGARDGRRAYGVAADRANQRFEPYSAAGRQALSFLLGAAGHDPTLQGPDPYGREIGGFDWKAYIDSNPDVAQQFRKLGKKGRRTLERAGYDTTVAGFGEWHWKTYGQREGRTAPPVFQGAEPVDAGPELSTEERGQELLSLILATPGYGARSEAIGEAVNQSNVARRLGISGKNVLDESTVQGDLVNEEFNRLLGINSSLVGSGERAASQQAGIDTGVGQVGYETNRYLGEVGAAKIAQRRGAMMGAVNSAFQDMLFPGQNSSGGSAGPGGGANDISAGFMPGNEGAKFDFRNLLRMIPG
ncbi:MAG: hypothetical protein HRU11_09080 [Parvularculaceae bacterium]|nr:hypothetical protein [Parvularculaceae bacterium]